jgi:hypothetical protein
MTTLDDLESRLQTLLEIQFLKYLPGYKAKDKVYQQLATAMQNGLKEQEGTIFAPNKYVIIAHPSTLATWFSEPGLVKDLAEALHTAGEEAGFHFLNHPTVFTARDMNMTLDGTHIIASLSTERVVETRGMTIESQEEASIDPFHPNAFLILGGSKIIPVNNPVLNIGRRLNNQIIIEDPRVSRSHAQLRINKGRFTIFDLNSTGGTFVNGQRITQSILSPGDVISLAGVTLIFSQDLQTENGKGKVTTAPLSPISTDHPTVDNLQIQDKHKKKAKKK